MYTHQTEVRVIYGDTDLMGYVYYGNYPKYYERGRSEMIRSLGISYKELEEMGVMMPVRDMTIKYLKPAFYDDVLTVITTVSKIPETRMEFNYQIFNQNKVLIHTAVTTLIFLDTIKRRPIKAPDIIIEKLKPYFEN